MQFESMESRMVLVERKLPLVLRTVDALGIHHADREDLCNVGAIGLFKALDQGEYADEAALDARIGELVRAEVLRYLQEQGIHAGDRVVVEADHILSYMFLEYGIQLLGATFVPVEKDTPSARMEEIAAERSDIKVAKINVEEQPELASQFHVMSIPTLVVMENGKIVKQAMGARPKKAILAML